MNGYRLCGLLLATLNVIYSFVFLGISCSELYESTSADEWRVWMWIVVYTLNAALNTYLFLRMFKSDLLAIKVWFSCTIVILILRLALVDYAKQSTIYFVIGIVLTVYINIGIIIMIYIYKHFEQSIEQKKQTKGKRFGALNRTGRDVEAPAIGWNVNESINLVNRPTAVSEENERAPQQEASGRNPTNERPQRTQANETRAERVDRNDSHVPRTDAIRDDDAIVQAAIIANSLQHNHHHHHHYYNSSNPNTYTGTNTETTTFCWSCGDCGDSGDNDPGCCAGNPENTDNGDCCECGAEDTGCCADQDCDCGGEGGGDCDCGGDGGAADGGCDGCEGGGDGCDAGDGCDVD